MFHYEKATYYKDKDIYARGCGMRSGEKAIFELGRLVHYHYAIPARSAPRPNPYAAARDAGQSSRNGPEWAVRPSGFTWPLA